MEVDPACMDPESLSFDELMDLFDRFNKKEYADLLLHLALCRWCPEADIDEAMPPLASMLAFANVKRWGFKIRSRHDSDWNTYIRIEP